MIHSLPAHTGQKSDLLRARFRQFTKDERNIALDYLQPIVLIPGSWLLIRLAAFLIIIISYSLNSSGQVLRSERIR